jgi:hypothetical protein
MLRRCGRPVLDSHAARADRPGRRSWLRGDLGRSEQDWARSSLVGLCEEPVADCHQPVLQSALATELKIGSRIARMCRQSTDSRVCNGQAPLQLECEQQIGQLRLLVSRPASADTPLPVEVGQGDRAAA